MKFTKPLESRKLSSLLEKAVSREAKLWKVYVPKKPTNQDTDISPEKRDEAEGQQRATHLQQRIVGQTVEELLGEQSHVLRRVQTRKRCAQTARLTAQNHRMEDVEEVQCSGRVQVPVQLIQNNPLHPQNFRWGTTTFAAGRQLSQRRDPLIFLTGLSSQEEARDGDTAQVLWPGLYGGEEAIQDADGQAQGLWIELELGMHISQPADGLITLELEKLCPDWLALTVDLLHRLQIDSSQLICCRELVARCLSTHTASLPPNTVYICRPLPEPRDEGVLHVSLAPTAPSDPNSTHSRSAKRKVEQMEVDEYFDGIKRLYNEENPQEGALLCTAQTAGGGQPNAGSSPCPPLQPVRET